MICKPGCRCKSCRSLARTIENKRRWASGTYATRVVRSGEPEIRAKISASNEGKVRSAEARANYSTSLKRDYASGVRKPAPGSGHFNWSGGKQGAKYAAVLCPLGYKREHMLWTSNTPTSIVKLDFALLLEKINIEIDGPYHCTSPDEDKLRDSVLQRLGWKVIRITDYSW